MVAFYFTPSDAYRTTALAFSAAMFAQKPGLTIGGTL
jgi:hypothetical protein